MTLCRSQQGVAKVASTLASGAGFGAPIRRLVRDQLKKVEAYLAEGGEAGTLVKLTLYRLVPHAPYTVANYLLVGSSTFPTLSFVSHSRSSFKELKSVDP